MHDAPSSKISFDYAIVRVVPSLERGESLNVGLIVFCSEARFLDAKIELSSERLKLLAPNVDIETVEAHLQTIPRICAGGKLAGTIGQMTQRERFHWLVAPRSTIIQTSPGHCGLCDDPQLALEQLFGKIVKASG
jgi:hypothetical protein